MTATTASHGGMHGRRSSAGSTKSGKSRMDGLTMSSTTTTNSTSSDHPTRNHKSSDRLHKLASNSSSSTNLSGKRSKSHTNVADAGLTSSKSRKNPNSTSRTKLSSLALGSDRRKSATQLYKQKDQEEDQSGWTSTSENSTPSQSRDNSPDHKSSSSTVNKQQEADDQQDGRGRRQRKGDRESFEESKREGKKREEEEEDDEEEEEDEGLTMDTKRRGRMSNLKHQETKREPSPRFNLQDPPTPRAAARQLEELSRDRSLPSNNSTSNDTSTSNATSLQPPSRDLNESIHSVKSDGSDGTLAQEEETKPQGGEEASSILSGTETLNSNSIAATSISTSPRPPLDHQDSSASARTLRHNHNQSHSGAPSSPSSTRSKSSIRTRAPIPSRDSFSNSNGVAPPKLDTHNALVGALGALHEDRASDDHEMISNRFATSPQSDRRLSLQDGRMTGSVSAPQGWQDSVNDSEPYLIGSNSRSKRKASLGSVGSNINVPIAGPSMAGISKPSISRYDDDLTSTTSSSNHRRRGESSEPGIGNSTWNDYSDSIKSKERDSRVRTISTQSLGAADAARLAAKLRLARDGPEDRSFSSSYSANSTSAAAHALSRAGSAVGLSSLAMSSNNSNSRSNLSSSRINEESTKPAVSVFSRNDRKAPEPIVVNESSVYSSMFSHAEKYGSDGDNSGELTVRGKNDGKGKGDKRKNGNSSQKARSQVRYLLDYGLSGPPLTPSNLNNALLAPSFSTDEFDASWAPALANAAGLGLRNSSHHHHHSDQNGNSTHVKASKSSNSDFNPGNEQLNSSLDLETQVRLNSEMLATGTALANGPNASPLHFVHGLTSTSEDDFPLEEGELPTGLLFDGSSGVSINGTTRNIDPKTMRAIALTSHALAVARSHTVTRRFRDPMRESLNRVVRESGHWPGQLTPSEGPSSTYFNRRSNPTSPNPNVNNHGFSLSRTSSGDSRRPNFHRSNTGSNPNGRNDGLPSATEQPLQSLKRVWSSGGRGGLAALTRGNGNGK